MKRISVGRRLYVTILGVFLLFTVAFMLFQHAREKQYKTDTLNIKLQAYNTHLADIMEYVGRNNEKALDDFVREHYMHGLRVTLITRDGRVVYDNVRKDYENFSNHANRKEFADALATGSGFDIERKSNTLKHDYFYSATYLPKEKLVIRSALPYDSDLAKTLQTDRHYLLFAFAAMLLLTIVLWRFMSRLSDNITKLRIFARRAARNESLETEDLAEFPDDELGEIAERIISIYKNLESSRQEQDKLKRELTQNIAHELKTPVASIQGYLETIQDNENIDEATKRQFLDRCYAQSLRLSSLLQDISTLNRMDDARDFMDFEQVDISLIVDNIVKQTALQLQAKNMTFCNRLPAGVRVRGNQSLLYSVFRNLTDNAIAYAGKGTTITLESREDEDCLYFTFSDNGIGVPAVHLPRLFERFYRVDKGRSRKMGGTGLGLAIVKNAVVLHGGNISATNNTDGGLRFDFTIRKQH